MIKTAKRCIGAFLIIVLLAGGSAASLAASPSDLDPVIEDIAAYILDTVKSPQVGSVGGEWAVLGLARSGYNVPEDYFKDYYATVEAYVKACKGVLHEKKYTEYSRVVLALTAIGKDPADVGGYNLLTPLGDFDKTVWQGINGPIWALIALDSGNYNMPVNSAAGTQATRELYISEILSRQLGDGGFALSGTDADPDITAMALQALSKYRDRADAARVIDEALTCLSEMQDRNGGFASWGTTNSESVAQAIVALGELGIAIDDSRFVKDGNSLIDNLLTYYIKGSGFKHAASGGGSNQMATEQALYALVSAQRSISGKSSLYHIDDAISVSGPDGENTGGGLTGKSPEVTAQPILYPGKSFGDLSDDNPHKNQAAIEALASRGIIGGYDDGTFRPDNTMTRAEFAAIIVRALGLTPKASGVFSDVPSTSWPAPYIGTANSYGIVNGKSSSSFDPSGIITRQEAAVMVARAAKLCGMDTSMDTAGIRDVLAQFADYMQAADWSQEALAFCYSSGILDQADLALQPAAAITRGQIVQMLFNMLIEANLL